MTGPPTLHFAVQRVVLADLTWTKAQDDPPVGVAFHAAGWVSCLMGGADSPLDHPLIKGGPHLWAPSHRHLGYLERAGLMAQYGCDGVVWQKALQTSATPRGPLLRRKS